MSVCTTVPSASDLLAAARGVPQVSRAVPGIPAAPWQSAHVDWPAMPTGFDDPHRFNLTQGPLASNEGNAGSVGLPEGLPSRRPMPPIARASVAAHVPAAPATWTPSPELARYTALLDEANLEMIGHRADGLRRLHQFTCDGQGTTIEQLRTCGTIKTLPFLRMSKKVRENLLNREFVAAGRAFNRELLAGKIAAARRLGEISRDPKNGSEVQRLAGAVNVRSSTGMKVEWGEINDCEIPEHLMPPSVEEAMWMAGLFPAGEVVARAASGVGLSGEGLKAATETEKQKVETPLGKAVVRGTAILGGGFSDVEMVEDEKAGTPLGKAVIRVAMPCSNNKKNRFKKRRK